MLELSVDEFHWEKSNDIFGSTKRKSFWEAGGQDPGPAIWLARAWHWCTLNLERLGSNLRSAHSAGVGYVHFQHQLSPSCSLGNMKSDGILFCERCCWP